MSDDKSFRERVEEIRQRRAENQEQTMSSGFDGGFTDSGSDAEMSQLMEQMGVSTETLSANRVLVETDTEELEFTDTEVSRMDFQGQRLYSVGGEPDRRTPKTREVKQSTPDPDTSESGSGTRVFDTNDPESGEPSTGTRSSGVDVSFCPQCGAELEGFDDPRFCPRCRHELDG